jgi:succinate-semialdehyde dehydrogenase/glutarate-semialdehyde dehydrogenase
MDFDGDLPSERDLLEKVPTGLFVNGSWREARDNATFQVRDPSTGGLLVNVANASVPDGADAMDAACEAFADWSRTTAVMRADILRRAYDLLTSRTNEFALLITLEVGKPLAEARGEVAYAAGFLKWYSEEAMRIGGHYGRDPLGDGEIVVTQHPVGPCYLITPWNFPLAMATRKIGPAIAAGCTVVIKPSELAPLSTLLLASLFEEVGLPPGVLNVVTTMCAGPVSEPIIRDERLRKLSFTGSTAVGRSLLRLAADGVLRTSMELGGNAPFLVFDDADLERAVDGAMVAKFRNVGQACTAANRFIVQRSVAEDFVNRVVDRVERLKVGRGTEEGVSVGPLIDDRAMTKTARLVEDAIARGARLRTGGRPVEREGTFFEPTVLTDIHEDSDLLREEIFGPVLAVVLFDDEDEAVRIANSTNYGLVSYVYTESLRRGQRMIQSLETGMMGLNVGIISNPTAPFGGWKNSGIGREGGIEGISEYLESKYTLTDSPLR